jgi:hypothetical protein
MGLTLPQYASVCGCSAGSPYTSLVEASRKRARVRFARPSMFMVPRNEVLIVLIGLYLHNTVQCAGEVISGWGGACH